MSRRRSAKSISGLKDATESRKPTGGGGGKRKQKKGPKENPMPLAPLQAHCSNPSVLVGGSKTPKRQQQIAKKTDRIARSMSPFLPEIPVTVNKEGVFEIERVPQETSATQTEPIKTVEKGTQTDELPDRTEPQPESIDYQLCCSDPPPSVYWEVMAEKRRVALKETIEENERLWQEIEALREEVKEGERQRNNALYFQFMYRLVAEETKNVS
ncbi:PREDICTED: uncharacterized protein LOC109582481 [Amphimedon queenslandica]|uniref:Geminin n=1 Tax=Amphimedon queenslandica TaxID=400682 RepID=A0A1X7URM6_AMPQE|nr:PREDICTED: uncharacterized protein LOC109582481 [Amphimedon queenslandica]|eukprot:XP_019852762.1 PREDICTED: uncharacterized protein LOC109582481 [Amphimedon queenslandica]